MIKVAIFSQEKATRFAAAKYQNTTAQNIVNTSQSIITKNIATLKIKHTVSSAVVMYLSTIQRLTVKKCQSLTQHVNVNTVQSIQHKNIVKWLKNTTMYVIQNHAVSHAHSHVMMHVHHNHAATNIV